MLKKLVLTNSGLMLISGAAITANLLADSNNGMPLSPELSGIEESKTDTDMT